MPDVTVGFAAGSEHDQVFSLTHKETLTSTWTQYAIDLSGSETGPNLLSGFSWSYRQTGRAITFYLDDIVWDDVGILPPQLPAGTKDGQRSITFINGCQQTIWVAIQTQRGAPPARSGVQIDPGQTQMVQMSNDWAGRFWGRTGCNFGGGGQGSCETGDCPGGLDCAAGTGAKQPVTLGEIAYSLDRSKDSDFYDVSMVDGFNLPLALGPMPGTTTRKPSAQFDCLTPMCAADVNAVCPGGLERKNGAGKTVACASGCTQTDDAAACCKPPLTADTCPVPAQSRPFKTACPNAYSYAYDDSTSTFTCLGEDYAAIFCPKARM
jgi:hypothetical protein